VRGWLIDDNAVVGLLLLLLLFNLGANQEVEEAAFVRPRRMVHCGSMVDVMIDVVRVGRKMDLYFSVFCYLSAINIYIYGFLLILSTNLNRY